MSGSMLNQHCSSHCRSHAAFIDARPAGPRKGAAGVARRQVLVNAAEKSSEQASVLCVPKSDSVDIRFGMDTKRHTKQCMLTEYMERDMFTVACLIKWCCERLVPGTSSSVSPKYCAAGCYDG